ncbi:MAG: hypothetical protein WAO10_04275, partial [Candidatus Sulfotelmatobacter sp.]
QQNHRDISGETPNSFHSSLALLDSERYHKRTKDNTTMAKKIYVRPFSRQAPFSATSFCPAKASSHWARFRQQTVREVDSIIC